MTRDPAVTSRIMSAVRSTGTRPEMLIRRELFARGLRYRVKNRLPGRPDIVFTRARVVVFVDGDWWHGNGWRVRGLASFDAQFNHRNSDWWRSKIEANVRRDRAADVALQTQGYKVIRLWESSVLADPAACADQVVNSVVHQHAVLTDAATHGRRHS